MSIALLLAAAPASAAPSRAQRACLTKLAAAGLRVARAAGAGATRCVKRGLAGKLPGGQSASECLLAERRRMTKARARTFAVERRKCRELPDFGPESATEVNDAYATAIPMAAVFGPNVDAALTAGRGDRAVAKCQRVVARYMARTVATRVQGFNACVRTGLRTGVVDDALDMAVCYGAESRRAARRLARLAGKVSRRCAGVDVAAAFPGTCAGESPEDLAGCVDRALECDVSLAVSEACHVALPHPHHFEDGVATLYCGERPERDHSVARQWNEELLDAIRIDLPRPPVHARNLFHVAVAMWDAWAAYDDTADGYVVAERHVATDVPAARDIAISFAAYRVLAARYALSVNAETSLPAFALRMNQLGYDPEFTSTAGDAPAAVGNRIGAAVLDHFRDDGANEAENYADPTYAPVNEPLIVKLPGTTMADPNRWQPLALDHQVSQNGIPIPGSVQVFVGPQWGVVEPFAIDFLASLPPPPPRLNDPETDDDFKAQALELIRDSSWLTPDDPTRIDISPASLGNNTLGADDGAGWPTNPATGVPYTPQLVKRGDFTRVIAEFWADGPTSETPPGHWNVLANYVTDHPLFERRFEGTGPVIAPLEWDVKLYLAIDGAVHDAAVGAWGSKRFYDSVRPISMIRYMGGLGQSSDPEGPAYHPDGLPLAPGVVEVVTAESSAPGERHEALADHVGEIAVRSWPGEPDDPTTQYSGVRWIRATEWVAYQRATFVTPPFASYVSGHSTFSRAAAEVLTRMTGSPFFPGGLGEFTASANDYLVFEDGPSETVVLQWATYYDASDQAGQSRLWGGIHIVADDYEGRKLGSLIGALAFERALPYFDGTAVP